MAIEAARLFIDIWGWLALADAKDPAHERAVQIRRSHTAPRALVTTDYILDETITRLFARSPFASAQLFCERIFEAREVGMIALESVTPERFERAWNLRLLSPI